MRLTGHAIILTVLGLLGQAEALYNVEQGGWEPHATGIGRVDGFRHGVGATAWTPLSQNGQMLVFGQGLGGYFQDQWVGGVGVGLRHAPSRCFGWGVNLFGDVSRYRNERVYVQGGIGGELFGPCWNLQFNGYLPTARPQRVALQSDVDDVSVNGNEVAVQRTNHFIREQAYRGFDLMAGAGFCIGFGELWGYGGYFRYDPSYVKPLQGPRARLEYRYENLAGVRGSEFHAGVEWQYERLHKSQTSFVFGVRVPFCMGDRCRHCECPSICRQMGREVMRENSIWIMRDREKQGTTTIEDLTLIFVAEETPPGNAPLCSQERPITIDQVGAFAGPCDVIILLNDYGTIALTDTLQLEDDQQLCGFLNNAQIQVQLCDGAVVIIDNLNDSGPAILNCGALSPAIQCANGNGLFDFHTTLGVDVIAHSGVNFNCHDVTIENCTGIGIDLTNATGTTVLNNVEIDGAGVACLHLENLPSCNVSNCLLENGAGLGIELINCTGSHLLSNNTIQNCLGGAVSFTGGSATCSFNGNAISSPAASALVQVSGGSNTIAFAGGSLTNLAGLGISVQNTTGGSCAFANATITNPVTAALTLTSNIGGVTCTNAAFDTFATATGLLMNSCSGPVALSGTLNQPAGGTAVNINLGSSIVNLSGCTINNDLSALNPIIVSGTTGGSLTLGVTNCTNVLATANCFNLSNNVGSLTCSPLTFSTSLGATGLLMNNCLGNVTISGSMNQSLVGGTAVSITAGSSTVDLSGCTINNDLSALNPIIVSGTTGGSLTLGVTNCTNVLAAANCFNLSNNVGSLTCSPLTFSTSLGATGLLMNNCSGPVTLSGTLNQPAGGTAVNINLGSSIVNLSGCTINNDSSAIVPISVSNTTAGSLHLGICDLTNVTATQAVLLSNNAASVRCNDLDITGTAGGRFEATSQIGALRVDTGTIDVTTSQAILCNNVLIDAAGVNFTSLGSTLCPSYGVDLNTVTGGACTLTTANISAPVSGAFRLVNCSSPFACNGGTFSTGPAAIGLEMNNCLGNVTLAGSLNQLTGGAAVSITAGSSIVNLSGCTINNDSSAIVPISVSNTTAGSLHLGICDLTNVTATQAVLLSNNAASVRCNDLDITGTAGGRFEATSQIGALRVDAGTIDVTASQAIAFSTVLVDGAGINFSDLSCVNSPTNGINLDTVTGGTIVIGQSGVAATATISGAVSEAIRILNGAPSCTYSGAVTNCLAVATVVDVTGGTITFDGTEGGASEALVMGAVAGDWLLAVDNSAANLLMRGFQGTGGTTAAIGINSCPATGQTTISQGTLTTFPVSSPVGVETILHPVIIDSVNCSDITLTAIDVLDSADVTISNCQFSQLSAAATAITNTAATTVGATVVGNSYLTLGILANSPVYQFTQGAGGQMDIDVTGNSSLRTNLLSPLGSGITFTNNGAMNIAGGSLLNLVDLNNLGVLSLSLSNGSNPIPQS